MQPEPTLDSDGHPSDETLELIKTWPHSNWPAMIEFIKKIWMFDSIWEEEDLLKMATSGWSGNESIIQAMQENWMFWSFCWELSKRGGYYEFDLKKIKEK